LGGARRLLATALQEHWLCALTREAREFWGKLAAHAEPGPSTVYRYFRQAVSMAMFKTDLWFLGTFCPRVLSFAPVRLGSA
jgi:hypothetical protein